MTLAAALNFQAFLTILEVCHQLELCKLDVFHSASLDHSLNRLFCIVLLLGHVLSGLSDFSENGSNVSFIVTNSSKCGHQMLPCLIVLFQNKVGIPFELNLAQALQLFNGDDLALSDLFHPDVELYYLGNGCFPSSRSSQFPDESFLGSSLSLFLLEVAEVHVVGVKVKGLFLIA